MLNYCFNRKIFRPFLKRVGQLDYGLCEPSCLQELQCQLLNPDWRPTNSSSRTLFFRHHFKEWKLPLTHHQSALWLTRLFVCVRLWSDMLLYPPLKGETINKKHAGLLATNTEDKTMSHHRSSAAWPLHSWKKALTQSWHHGCSCCSSIALFFS